MIKPTQAQIEATAKVLNVSYENKAYSRKIAKAALTAAAEAGDNEVSYSEDDLREIINANIERCAQVAENLCYENAPNNGAIIAAAIRALKDKT